MSNPTWKDFFVRVGGVLALLAVTILVTGALFPGHEGAVVIVVAAVLVVVAALRSSKIGEQSNARTDLRKNVK